MVDTLVIPEGNNNGTIALEFFGMHKVGNVGEDNKNIFSKRSFF